MTDRDFSRLEGELSVEFAKLMIEAELDIPLGAHVFFEIDGEQAFNRSNRERAAQVRNDGEPVVFIRVAGLVPKQSSRLIAPRVLEAPAPPKAMDRTIDPERFNRVHGELVSEFLKLTVERPEIEQTIPSTTAVIFELAGDDEFNSYGHELARRRRDEGWDVVFLRVEGLAPAQGSRLISPRVVRFSDAA